MLDYGTQGWGKRTSSLRLSIACSRLLDQIRTETSLLRRGLLAARRRTRCGFGRGRRRDVGNVDAGLRLWNCAVVNLHLSRRADDDKPFNGPAARRNEHSFSYIVFCCAHGNGDIRGRVACVGDVDRDQVGACLRCVRKDTVDGEIGQPFVGIDPVGKEPCKVAMGASLLQKSR